MTAWKPQMARPANTRPRNNQSEGDAAPETRGDEQPLDNAKETLDRAKDAAKKKEEAEDFGSDEQRFGSGYHDNVPEPGEPQQPG